jgi:hypothetical protein
MDKNNKEPLLIQVRNGLADTSDRIPERVRNGLVAGGLFTSLAFAAGIIILTNPIITEGIESSFAPVPTIPCYDNGSEVACKNDLVIFGKPTRGSSPIDTPTPPIECVRNNFVIDCRTGVSVFPQRTPLAQVYPTPLPTPTLTHLPFRKPPSPNDKLKKFLNSGKKETKGFDGMPCTFWTTVFENCGKPYVEGFDYEQARFDKVLYEILFKALTPMVLLTSVVVIASGKMGGGDSSDSFASAPEMPKFTKSAKTAKPTEPRKESWLTTRPARKPIVKGAAERDPVSNVVAGMTRPVFKWLTTPREPKIAPMAIAAVTASKPQRESTNVSAKAAPAPKSQKKSSRASAKTAPVAAPPPPNDNYANNTGCWSLLFGARGSESSSHSENKGNRGATTKQPPQRQPRGNYWSDDYKPAELATPEFNNAPEPRHRKRLPDLESPIFRAAVEFTIENGRTPTPLEITPSPPQATLEEQFAVADYHRRNAREVDRIERLLKGETPDTSKDSINDANFRATFPSNYYKDKVVWDSDSGEWIPK